MIALWLLSVASANDTFTLLRTSDTCTIRKREKTASAGAAMWARCTWPDTEPAVLRRMFADLTRYDEWIWPIGESRIERREPSGRLLVYQRQHIWALADREVLLWVDVQETPNRLEVRWTTANTEPLVLQKGAVRTPRNLGHWILEAAPAGGTTVEHQIEVDAGGLALPAWLVRAVQTRGFNRILSDVHDAAVDQAKPKTE